MGSGPSWKRINADLKAAQAAATEAERRRCAEVIEAWNERIKVRRNPDPSPAIGVALTAGYRWLSVYCPACRQVATVDLAGLDRHPETPIASLITSLTCRGCRKQGPLPKLRGLSTYPPEPIWKSTILPSK